MTITKLETFAYNHVGLLKVSADTGEIGWGQIATTEAADIVAQVIHRQAASVVLGGNNPDC